MAEAENEIRLVDGKCWMIRLEFNVDNEWP